MTIVYSKALKHGRFETWSAKPHWDFLSAKQVHGIDIVSTETLPCDADGLFVSWNDFKKPLAIKTADCMPIIIEGAKGVIFLHAGWKGLAAGILKRPEIVMIEPGLALIGPSIHVCCFEVSPDFNQNFLNSSHFTEHQGKYYFDLQAHAREQLLQEFPDLKVEVAAECTMCQKQFHSYRRDKTIERNWNIYIKG